VSLSLAQPWPARPTVRPPHGASSAEPRGDAASAPVLELVRVAKSFGNTHALRDVDFELRPGEIHALVGENGAGKSTLIRILAGDHVPDGGEIRLEGRALRLRHPRDAGAAGIGFVHQSPAFAPDLSITENLLLGLPFTHRRAGLIDWRAHHRECAASLVALGLPVDPRRPLASLSAHQRQMVALARALHHRPKVLVLDEVTASLSEPEVRILLDTIRTLCGRGVSVIYVSHRLEEVFGIADRVTVLRNGRRISTRPVAEFDEARLVQEIVGSEVDQLFGHRSGTAPAIREPLLSVRGLGDARLRDASFEVGKGEIVGIAGLGGSGRSRLLKLLFGAVPRRSGRVWLEGREQAIRSVPDALRAGIALVTEDRNHDGYVDGLPIWQNVTLPWLTRFRAAGFVRRREEQRRAQAATERFAVRMPSIDASMSALSGGNQQKILFARWLIGPVRLLLLDEPTHGVDIGAKSQIYAAIRELAAEGRAVLVVSSELEELEALCDRVLLLKDGVLDAELSGAEISKDAMLHRLLSPSGATETVQ